MHTSIVYDITKSAGGTPFIAHSTLEYKIRKNIYITQEYRNINKHVKPLYFMVQMIKKSCNEKHYKEILFDY